MGKSYVENSLKRFLKRKVKVTLGMVVAFLITGTVSFCETAKETVISELIELSNAGQKIIETENDLKLTADGNFIRLFNDTTSDGYTVKENEVYLKINSKGNIFIGDETKKATGGIVVSSCSRTVDINTDRGIYLNSEALDIIQVYNSGHVNINAKDDIILNVQGDGNDFGYDGYISNVNVNYGGNQLTNVTGLRKSSINISTDGNIVLNGKTERKLNVGIFGYGLRKNHKVTNGDEEKNKPFVDEDGYVMSDENKTYLKGKKININIGNTSSGAMGIWTKGSDKVFVDLESQEGIELTVNSLNSQSAAINILDGNVSLKSLNGSNIVKGETGNNQSMGVGILAAVYSENDYYSNKVSFLAQKDNVIFGTTTAVAAGGKETKIDIKNIEGTNLLQSENGDVLDVNFKGKVSLISEKGNNAIKTKTEGQKAISILSGGQVELNAGNLNEIIGNILVDGENSLLHLTGSASTVTSKNDISVMEKGKIEIDSLENKVTAKLLAQTGGEISAKFNGANSNFTGAASLGESNDGIINLTVNNREKWNNTANSTVSSLDFNNGIVDMSYTKDNQDLTIKNMLGENGIFVMDISTEDLKHENGKTDFINVEDADKAQTHFIEIGKNSIEELLNYDFDNKNPDKAIWFADTDQNVSFKGKTFSSLANVLDYTPIIETNKRDFSTNGTNWYITGLDKEENEVPQTVIDDLSFLYNAAISRLELDTLHKRMGEIRNYENTQGIWFRTSAGELKSDVSDSSFENDYYMLQVGYDKKKVSEKGNWFTGFAVSRRQNDIDFRNGDGESENIGLSLYRSFAGKNNTYFDLIGKYTYLDTEYKVHNSNSEMKADYDTWAGTLSAEFGKKYSSKNDKWYITPHAQLNYTYVNGEDYTTSTGVKVEQDNIDSLIGRIGVYAGKDFEKSSHYLKVSVLNEFMGDYGAVIKGADTSFTKKIDGDDTWTEVGIGGNFQVGNSGTTHIYYDVEKTFGSRFETQWQGTLGFRISFDKINDLFTAPAKPLTKNKTKEGRTTNRKVEVNYN